MSPTALLHALLRPRLLVTLSPGQVQYHSFIEGNGTGCVLLGIINKPVVLLAGSKWFLIDLSCTVLRKFTFLYETVLTSSSKVEWSSVAVAVH
jgi:hypothetical protein